VGQRGHQGHAEVSHCCHRPHPRLSPEQSSSSCPHSVFLCSGHFTFLDFLSVPECTGLICASGPWHMLVTLSRRPPSPLVDFSSSSGLQLHCHISGNSPPSTSSPTDYIRLFSWIFSVHTSSCLAWSKVVIHSLWDLFPECPPS